LFKECLSLVSTPDLSKWNNNNYKNLISDDCLSLIN
jgi:hypothetical protein